MERNFPVMESVEFEPSPRHAEELCRLFCSQDLVAAAFVSTRGSARDEGPGSVGQSTPTLTGSVPGVLCQSLEAKCALPAHRYGLLISLGTLAEP